MSPEDIRSFVSESNRIEGIRRRPTSKELLAHIALLQAPALTVQEVSAFVQAVAGKPIRSQIGMDVRVGNHFPPKGGPYVWSALQAILSDANRGAHPYGVHQAYEHLHPFMDGNGRSGRAIWLWQMMRQRDAQHVLTMGFLHAFYYQALEAGDGRT